MPRATGASRSAQPAGDSAKPGVRRAASPGPRNGSVPLRGPGSRATQLVRYSSDLKVNDLVTSGASAILRILPQVCL